MSVNEKLGNSLNSEGQNELAPISAGTGDGRNSVPLPRPTRRQRRSAVDRGLPESIELTRLAGVYLDRQRKLWPEHSQLLAEATEAELARMATDFAYRHRGGPIDAARVRAFIHTGHKLGGAYNRFSCDNSNPLSVSDQLSKILDKAKSENRFIPWEHVFADFAVTGLDASRQGYKSYKAALGNEAGLIETTYIDDFTRASRDEIEWWKLAFLSKRLNKRMIGASDGFDLSSGDCDLKITIYGLVSRLFLKGLREKVRRGMRGAAQRGTCLGKLSLGHTRCVARDAAGNVVNGPDGLPIHKPCIDPATAPNRELMYELFVEKGWTSFKIARHFSKLAVDGWKGWTTAGVNKLLWSPTAIGVFVWNKFRTEYDPETNRRERVRNPRAEWVVHHDPSLALVSMNVWKAARKRLAKIRRRSPQTGRRLSRNQISATTLFSGTLFCSHCGEELKLIRSTPQYKQIGCLKGAKGHHDCQLSGSKSVRQVEDCLLDFLLTNLLSEVQVEQLVQRANELLEEESAKPTIAVQPIKAEIRQLDGRVRKLVEKVEETDDRQLSQSYHTRILELQKKLNVLRTDLRTAEATNKRRVEPLTSKQALVYLTNFRDLLSQGIPQAAEAIRQLTGPIQIRQEPITGKKRMRWIASFSPDLWRAICFANPAAATEGSASENLASGSQIDVVIDKLPAYEKLAPKFKLMREQGASLATIANAHGMTSQQVSQALRFADTGERPKFKSGKRTGQGGKLARYLSIAEEVASLRDRDKRSFVSLAKHFKVDAGTIRRAYDHARPAAVQLAAMTGKQPSRGTYSHLGAKVKQVEELLKKGKSVAEVAKRIGCGKSTVERVKKAM